MSRPVSAPRVRPISAGKNGTKNGGISYEDMLVAQYLDELQKAPLRYSLTGTSPYSQRLANNHVVPFTQSNHYERKPRPFSAVNVTRPQSGKHSKYGDGVGWDGHTPRSDKRRGRPVSAPVYKTRPLSAATYSSHGSRPMSGKSFGSRRVKALYKRQPHTIVVTAYKNGSRDTFARIVAPNLKMLLEICTEKLELGNAARRVFLGNGKEVFMARDIPRDSDVFVSMGEPFKNPYHSVKNHQEQQKNIAWTMHGLIWTSETKRKPAKTKLSKRFQSLIETSRRRVLVFKNGSGNDGIEIVADPERFEEFLQSCTAKLSLTSYARVLFDWEGNPITDLKDAPMLDQCLQTWSTPVLGPLWVSKGEGFSPSGVNDFLQSMITYTKAKLAEAKDYLQELRKAKENNKEDVNIAAILSMGDSEIDEALEIVDKDIEDFTNALNRLKGQMRKLQGEVQQEEAEKSNYKLSHIEQIDTQHRLVGSKGLRIKVYENGTYEEPVILYFNLTQALRGIGHDQKKLMERLLDQCSNSHYLNNPKTNTALRPMAQKIFDKFGKEIKNVNDIEYDSEVWLSFGEPYKNPFTFVLTAMYDKAKGYEIQGTRRFAREQLMIEDVKGKESWTQWESFSQWPDDQEVRVFEADNPMDMEELDHVQGLLEMGEIPAHASFLRHKENPNLLLFGDIAVDTKKSKGSNDIWPADAQSWLITEDGYIRSKAFPRLVLSVSDSGVSCHLTNPLKGVQETRVEGLFVWLTRKEEHAANQQWFFTTDGHICPKSHPDLALTYIGIRFGDEESVVTNESESAMKGFKPYVAVCEKLEGKDEKCQRWAIKQERMDNFGQWKHSEISNAEWNKKALSWPVNDQGELIDKFDWPMEGYIIPYAPPLKVEKKTTNYHVAPLRLTVLKNGVRDTTKSLQVVGPDLSNMKKDKVKSKTKAKKKEIRDDESIQEDMNVLKLEFTLFLERATGMLDLPFAARRLFDAEGKEHFTLQSLKRDQLVYVSCGEPWSDPNLSKAEQQRRYLLANLASDVGQMRQFMALRNPQTKGQGHLPEISKIKAGKQFSASLPNVAASRMKLPQVKGKSQVQAKSKVDHHLPKVNQGSRTSLIGSRSLPASRSLPTPLNGKIGQKINTGFSNENKDGVTEGVPGVDDGITASENAEGPPDDAYGTPDDTYPPTNDAAEQHNGEDGPVNDLYKTGDEADVTVGADRDANSNEADRDAENEDEDSAAINIRGYQDSEIEDTNREGFDYQGVSGNSEPTEDGLYSKSYENEYHVEPEVHVTVDPPENNENQDNEKNENGEPGNDNEPTENDNEPDNEPSGNELRDNEDEDEDPAYQNGGFSDANQTDYNEKASPDDGYVDDDNNDDDDGGVNFPVDTEQGGMNDSGHGVNNQEKIDGRFNNDYVNVGGDLNGSKVNAGNFDDQLQFGAPDTDPACDSQIDRNDEPETVYIPESHIDYGNDYGRANDWRGELSHVGSDSEKSHWRSYGDVEHSDYHYGQYQDAEAAYRYDTSTNEQTYHAEMSRDNDIGHPENEHDIGSNLRDDRKKKEVRILKQPLVKSVMMKR